jgi:lipopolysaccharide/colanic/teichoic acid biosynthesis glycosyltransferase
MGVSMFGLSEGHWRAEVPSSRTRLLSRIALFDLLWAGVSPFIAFLLRDGMIKELDKVMMYAGMSLVITVVVFQWFKISAPMPGFFSIRDAIGVWKACLVSVAVTAALLFTFTRLDHAPRSIPIIQFLVLGCGLLAARTWHRLRHNIGTPQQSHLDDDVDYIIVIGATRLASFFSRIVEEVYSNERRIVALLDDRPELINRTLNGYPIVGTSGDLARIIDEYGTHGIDISKVVVVQYPHEMTDQAQHDIAAACSGRNIPVEWLYETLALSHGRIAVPGKREPGLIATPAAVAARPYWKVKRLLDIALASAMLVMVAPLMIVVGVLVFVDVGFPLVFWQQRIGRRGRPIRVYKFRTMQGAHDALGRRIPETERLSLLGQLLRKNHLDELPQLFNVLGGSMSIVGPRPLLPVDQPQNIRFRLEVSPGLTGLAQISGGTALTPDEKDALDDWYVRHASLPLDLSIILRTIWVIVRGNPRDDARLSVVLAERYASATHVPHVDAGEMPGQSISLGAPF